jgi:hypothetical protein
MFSTDQPAEKSAKEWLRTIVLLLALMRTMMIHWTHL